MDPMDDFAELIETIHSRRFWGNALAGFAILLIAACVSTAPGAPGPLEGQLLIRLAVVAGLAGLLLDE